MIARLTLDVRRVRQAHRLLQRLQALGRVLARAVRDDLVRVDRAPPHVVALVLPGDPLVSIWRVERRGEFGTLGPLASRFLALGSGLGLVGTVSPRR